jgi:aspartate ammonia-lyase
MKKGKEFGEVLKSGRTHLRDAVPMTLGQEFTAYSNAIKRGNKRIEEAEKGIRELFIGGTAVGTGLNTHPEYPPHIKAKLEELTGLEFSLANDFIERTQFTSDYLEYANALMELTCDLVKISNDLMLLSSGPNTGLREIKLPSVEPGSSIMPGKINPSILEALNMVCFQVQGNCETIKESSKQGLFDLNVYTPLLAFNLINSIKWLTNGVKMAEHRCVKGIKANEGIARKYFQRSAAFTTLLIPVIGYDKAAELTERALERGIPIREYLLEEGVLTRDQLDKLLEYSTQPNLHVLRKIREHRSPEDEED